MPPTCFRNLRELYIMLCFPFIFFCCFLLLRFPGQYRTGQSRHQHRNLPVSPSGSLFCHLQSRLTQHFNFLHCRVRGQWKRCETAAGRMAKAAARCVNGETKAKKLSTDCFTYFPFNCAAFTTSQWVQSIFGQFSLHLIFNIISFFPGFSFNFHCLFSVSWLLFVVLLVQLGGTYLGHAVSSAVSAQYYRMQYPQPLPNP